MELKVEARARLIRAPWVAGSSGTSEFLVLSHIESNCNLETSGKVKS